MTNAQKKQELNNKLSLPLPENEKEAASKELERIKNLPDHWEYAAEGESASERILNENRGTTSEGIADASGTIINKAGHGNQDQNRLAIGNTESIGKIDPKTGRPENYGEVVGSNVDTEGNKVVADASKVAAAAGIDATPDKNDTPTEKEAKKHYSRAMMSIWDAVREGEIDKDTAAYFTIDAIATLAKNLGRGIGNVGAQFTGGTIDQGHDTSKWEERRNRLLQEENEIAAESMGGPSGRKAEMENLDIAAKRIRNEYTPEQLETQLGLLQKELEMAGINVNLASSKTDIINHIKSDPDYSNSPFKMGIVAYLSQAGMAGAANAGGNTLANAANWLLTLAK